MRPTKVHLICSIKLKTKRGRERERIRKKKSNQNTDSIKSDAGIKKSIGVFYLKIIIEQQTQLGEFELNNEKIEKRWNNPTDWTRSDIVVDTGQEKEEKNEQAAEEHANKKGNRIDLTKSIMQKNTNQWNHKKKDQNNPIQCVPCVYQSMADEYTKNHFRIGILSKETRFTNVQIHTNTYT